MLFYLFFIQKHYFCIIQLIWKYPTDISNKQLNKNFYKVESHFVTS